MKIGILKKLLCISISYIVLIPFCNFLPEIIPGSDWIYHNILQGGLNTIMFGILTTVITTVFLKKMEIQKELNQIKYTIFLQFLWSLNFKQHEEKKIINETIPKLIEHSENIKQFKLLLVPYLERAINRINSKYFEPCFLTYDLGKNKNFKNRENYINSLNNRITILHYNKNVFPTQYKESVMKYGLKKDLEKNSELKNEYNKNGNEQYIQHIDSLKNKYKVYLEENFYKYILEEVETLIRINKIEKSLYKKIINGQII